MSGSPSPDRPRSPGEYRASVFERSARFWRTVNRLAEAAETDCAIGATPADPVLQHDRLTLWHYHRTAKRRGVAPVLIVHGFIGRASVTDLAPDRSVVRDLLAVGVDVFTIHWGEPSRADRFLTIADYLDDHLTACIAKVRRLAGRAPVLLGICEGGVFSLCHAARAPAQVAGLALAVTPVDCHADPNAAITRWVRAFSPAELSRLIDSLGTLPGAAIAAAFQAMTPARTMAKYTSGLNALSEDPDELLTFLRMEAWLRDRPDHPGEAARQLLVEHYHENRLARGTLMLDGAPVDLAQLRMPVLNIWGLRDGLVPPACAAALGALLPNAAYTPCPLDTGHIGVFVSRRALGQLASTLVRWLDHAGVTPCCRGAQGTS